ncbi:hypothetical protein SFK315_1074 [Shigella flexneri K-315]|uniref:Uncharacterized protein n=1 Tax=Shigella flexneri K-315 TaxID=766150 RepID=I6CZU2_SHIFL|nr:hypothetical protein SFK315_1074 [Shigella flexneri K-315]
MWRYRITRLLSRKYPDLVMPDALAAEGSSKREWNRFLDTHYRRGWNVNVSRVMDNATHVAVYFWLLPEKATGAGESSGALCRSG